MGFSDWFRKSDEFDKWQKTPKYRGTKKTGALNDEHVGGWYEDNHEMPHILEKYANMKNSEIVALNLYIVGDETEFKCAPPELIPYLMDLDRRLELAFNHDDDGNELPPELKRKTRGNHNTPEWDEKYNNPENRFLHIRGGTRNYGASHGHLEIDELKNDDYWKKYCDKQNGATKAKRVQSWIFDKFDFVKGNRKLPKGLIQLLHKKCVDMNKDGWLIAHFHVDCLRFYYPVIDGVEKEIIALPAHQEIWLWL